ncbi:sporulene cyclase [Bacillus sp. OV322]|uniref:terpene cyclase/mutase family protein n=1 Tax=Bacillus sp. OV322 TaxID=1882764 RepID=UPI0008EC3519|nr:prenyltransferase/squalene oxidase repeat-containing protein [Bacillus sp. OV322]SFC27521.1 sporulene cyclase [Bacillus sp. OV322]
MQNTQSEIGRIAGILVKDQLTNGSWDYPFETGLVSDAFMIILLRILERNDEQLIRRLTDRIISRQGPNGAWKLFHDENEGNLSLTIEAYYALLYSGLKHKDEPDMRKARSFIRSRGGLKKARMFTKMMLTITGQYSYPPIFPIPLVAVLLPPSFFASIYDLSVYARSNFIPLLLLADRKFQAIVANTPDLSDLLHTKKTQDDSSWEEFGAEGYRSIFSSIKHGAESLIDITANHHTFAEKAAEKFMLERIEPDGTLYNYFSSTFFMIIALLSLGYSKNDPVIVRAVEGLKATVCTIGGHIHIPYTTAHLWNTALISYSLQESKVQSADDCIKKANGYLLSRQHTRYGDWAIHNSKAIPGGWGFSDFNTINPDLDDTSASLRALIPKHDAFPQQKSSWMQGLSFILSMQNDDGGFPAFEKNTDKHLFTLLPIEGADTILTDPSTPDLTGRTLEFLGTYANLKKTERSMKKAVSWLLHNQRNDGSWYGRWGICYIYGTWGALTGLMAAGFPHDDRRIKKAAKWLMNIQNSDGGWGESCYSDIKKEYVPLGASTLIHTAWAVDALISQSPHATDEIDRGISFLIKNGEKEDWTTSYPAGQGLAGYVYAHYHSYRYIFPLLALSHYRRKYSD